MYSVTGFRSIGIPKEIVDVLFKGGMALIIKGDAGTGKTKMALEIMNIAKDFGLEPIYFTVGVPSEQVKSENPWLEEKGLDKQILDLTIGGDLLDSNSAKLGLVNVPNFLRSIINSINKISEESNKILLVLDSIDETKTLIGLPENDFSLERYFLNLIKGEKKNISLILIKESLKSTQLDFLGDIIVELYYKDFEGKILREMKIKKLRSQKIAHSHLMFTLNSGRFKTLEPFPFNTETFVKYINYTSVPKSRRERLKTGIQSIDSLASGGFKRGDLVVIETDALSSTLMNTLAYYLTRNFVKNKIPVFILPRYGGILEVIFDYLKVCLKESDLEYVTYFSRYSIERYKENIAELSSESFEDNLRAIIETIEKKRKKLLYKGPVVNIFSLENVLIEYTIEDIKNAMIRNLMSKLRRESVLFIELPKLPSDKAAIFLKNATYYIKATAIRDYVIMYGIKPHTGLVIPCIEFIEKKKRKKLIIDAEEIS